MMQWTLLKALRTPWALPLSKQPKKLLMPLAMLLQPLKMLLKLPKKKLSKLV